MFFNLTWLVYCGLLLVSAPLCADTLDGLNSLRALVILRHAVRAASARSADSTRACYPTKTLPRCDGAVVIIIVCVRQSDFELKYSILFEIVGSKRKTKFFKIDFTCKDVLNRFFFVQVNLKEEKIFLCPSRESEFYLLGFGDLHKNF